MVRRRYVEGASLRTITAETGVKNHVIYRCLAGDFADGSGVPPAPIARRKPGVRAAARGARSALVARLWRAAERQVREVEKTMKAAGIDVSKRHSNARMLAVVIKTVRDLASLDEANKSGKEAANEHDDDAVPRNVEDLRRALAEKLERFVAERHSRIAGGSQSE